MWLLPEWTADLRGVYWILAQRRETRYGDHGAGFSRIGQTSATRTPGMAANRPGDIRRAMPDAA